jgi:hypothetical protein
MGEFMLPGSNTAQTIYGLTETFRNNLDLRDSV